MGHIFLPLTPSGVARTEPSIVSCVGGSRSKRFREDGETRAFGQLPATRVKGKKMRGAAGGESQITRSGESQNQETASSSRSLLSNRSPSLLSPSPARPASFWKSGKVHGLETGFVMFTNGLPCDVTSSVSP